MLTPNLSFLCAIFWLWSRPSNVLHNASLQYPNCTRYFQTGRSNPYDTRFLSSYRLLSSGLEDVHRNILYYSAKLWHRPPQNFHGLGPVKIFRRVKSSFVNDDLDLILRPSTWVCLDITVCILFSTVIYMLWLLFAVYLELYSWLAYCAILHPFHL